MSRILSFLFLPALLLLSACSSLNITPINLNITKIVSNTDGTLTLHLAYSNVNTLALPVIEQSHRLTLNGVKIPTIDSEDAVGVPVLGTITQALPLDKKTSDLIRPLFAQQKTLPYEIRTKLYITLSEDEKPTARAIGSGTVTLE